MSKFTEAKLEQAFIELLENETLIKGEYYITVYHDNQLIGSATATFN